MSVNVGEYVSTEYADDSSDYVSSTERNTPFPSLTLSKKFELERYIHQGIVVSRFSNENICKPHSMSESRYREPSSMKDLQQIERIPLERGCNPLEELRSKSLRTSSESVNKESVSKESANNESVKVESVNKNISCCLLI